MIADISGSSLDRTLMQPLLTVQIVGAIQMYIRYLQLKRFREGNSIASHPKG